MVSLSYKRSDFKRDPRDSFSLLRLWLDLYSIKREIKHKRNSRIIVYN